MAFSTVIRRAASRFAPLAIRASAGTTQRYFHHQSSSALFAAAVSNCSRRSFPLFSHRFSTKSGSDASLLRVLESEIQDAIDSQADAEIEEVPEGFPFEIEDQPGQQTITLHRKMQGETISVEVHTPDLDSNEQDNEDDDDEEGGTSSSLPLVVKISKPDGPSLEFGCTAYADEVAIESLSVKEAGSSDSDDLAYEGPDFTDLDENLQKAFHKYLEIRGIKPSTTNFLHGYMIEKDGKEYATWLQNIKKFVEA